MATQKLSAQSSVDQFFSISERGSTLTRELRGGLVTFVTMVYIVVLNPLIVKGQVAGAVAMGSREGRK